MWLFPQSRFGHFRCRKRKSKTTFLLSLYTGYYGVFLMSRSEKKRQRILGFNLPILILSFLDVLASLGSMLESQSVPGPQNRRTRRTCAEDQRKLGGPKSWLTKFSSLDSWGTNNHAIGGWRTKDILGGPKSLETKKLDGTRWGQGGAFCVAKF